MPDISKVDYTEGNVGITNLQPLENLPIFLEDIYVFGYLAKEEIYQVGGKHTLSTGENGTAKKKVTGIHYSLAQSSFSKYVHANIIHMLLYTSSLGIVSNTIRTIENTINNRVLEKWMDLEEKKPFGISVAKLDVSDTATEEKLPKLCKQGYIL